MRLLSGFAFAAMTAAILAGCGGSSSYTTAPSPVTSGGGSGSTGANVITINITSNNGSQSFSPNPASIQNGQMVVWHNADSVTHRVVLNDGSIDTGSLAPGQSSAAKAWTASSAQYHCSIHPSMVGSVNASTSTSPGGACDGYYC